MEWCKNPKMHKYPSRDGLEFISREGGLLDLWDIFLRILKIHNGLIIIPTDPLPFQLYVCVSCRQNSSCLKGKILMTSQPVSNFPYICKNHREGSRCGKYWGCSFPEQLGFLLPTHCFIWGRAELRGWSSMQIVQKLFNGVPLSMPIIS
ncbi:hypothetical protein SAY87_000093 [Trapa incisa]|uniref:Uncharacterized protein n=1 Tax=Trapa incisa TaxID=236973 RepID=A0AAN7GSY8_9MYRT|nr:hypothetical protein SAY87_000093 [Trapa incisa]